jgi:hypothetical protein
MEIKIEPIGDFSWSPEGLVALIKILHENRSNIERNNKL